MSQYPSKQIHIKEEDITRLLKTSEELMQMGLAFSGDIEAALLEFKTSFELSLKTHFIAVGVSEMLTKSFQALEKKVQLNLDGINKICTEGGGWYSFYLGTALGRKMPAPESASPPPENSAAKAAS